MILLDLPQYEFKMGNDNVRNIARQFDSCEWNRFQTYHKLGKVIQFSFNRVQRLAIFFQIWHWNTIGKLFSLIKDWFGDFASYMVNRQTASNVNKNRSLLKSLENYKVKHNHKLINIYHRPDAHFTCKTLLVPIRKWHFLAIFALCF